jgi:hypothetical protein
MCPWATPQPAHTCRDWAGRSTETGASPYANEAPAIGLDCPWAITTAGGGMLPRPLPMVNKAPIGRTYAR